MPKVRFAPAAATHRHRLQDAIARGRAKQVDRVELTEGGAAAAARWLEGAATFGDRDGARALRLIRDPSRRVRGIAIASAPLACDDAQATAALHAAWQVRGERGLLRRMARAGRTTAIDAFLAGLADAGHLRELVDDLPFGSAAAVRRHLAHALERPSVRFWSRLAVGHPEILAELLLARWRAVTGEADPVTRQLTAAHHVRISDRVPALGIELADVLLSRGIEPGMAVWTALLRERPDDAVALAVCHGARVPAGVLAPRLRRLAPALLAQVMALEPRLLGDFGPEVRALSPARRQALAEAWHGVSAQFPVHGAYLLRELPAATRDDAYARWSLAARDQDGAIDPRLIAALPIELAAREAARHVDEVVALATDATRRLRQIARYLPWPQLEHALRDHLGHPEGELRAVAIAELLANPGVYPDEPGLAARALALVIARKFEQDPVRAAMIGTLARWPRRIWRAEHLPAVTQIVRDALDASDLSVATARLVEQLIVRLFGVDGAWAAGQLALSIKERGALYDANLGAKLSEADLRFAAPHLVAIATSWTTQERAPWLVAFATGLGARLAGVAGLAELVADARDATPWEWIAQQLTEVLARHAPALHAATIEAALARYAKRGWHGATFAVARIDGLVGRAPARRRYRQMPTLAPAVRDAVRAIAEQLDPKHAPTALAILRQRDPEAFDRVVARVVARDESVVVVADVARWIDRHRQDLLAPYLGGRRIRGAWATGKTRWVMPFGAGYFRWTPAQAEQLAEGLGAIVGDPGRDTPAVLEALVTWPRLEWARMDRLCASASDARPVVREKAIRVLARCDAGQGVPTLLACLGDDRARFAVYGLRRALFAMPPDAALALLADAPMRKVTVAKEVVRLTGELRAAGAFARLGELASGPLHRDVRIAVLRALWDHLDREEAWAIFERAVGDPDWVLASRLADIPADRLTAALDERLAGLLAQVLARPEPEARIGLLGRARSLALVDRGRQILRAIYARLASPYDDEVRAAMTAVLARAAEADLPALGEALAALRADPRAFHVAAHTLCAAGVRTRASWRRAAALLVDVALGDPRWSAVAIQAAAARANGRDLVATIERATLDHDATAAAITAIAQLDDRELAAAVAALIASPSASVRRIAVGALAHDARASRGWTDTRRAQLARLRGDPSPDVAGAAARLWPPREQDPGW